MTILEDNYWNLLGGGDVVSRGEFDGFRHIEMGSDYRSRDSYSEATTHAKHLPFPLPPIPKNGD